MHFSQKNTTRSRIFYGWYVLAAGFLLLFFQSGARFSFGVMFKPMIAELGWNRASISLAFFLHMVFFALTLSLAGKLYDRYGPRWVILASTVLIAAGYISTSRIETLWQFHLFYGVITAVGVGGASVPLIAALMSKWFTRRRGLAISLSLSGSCLGQFVLVPIINWIVLAYGWRFSYFRSRIWIYLNDYRTTDHHPYGTAIRICACGFNLRLYHHHPSPRWRFLGLCGWGAF